MNKVVGIVLVLFALAQAGSSAGADSGPVGNWRLDERGGAVAADSSEHGNNGVVHPDATWVSGRFGSALSFDGITGRVQVVSTPSLEPLSAVSVSAWIKHARSPGDYRYVLAKGATGCIAASYGLYSGPNGGLMFYVSKRRGSVYARSPDAGTRVWDGNWHFAVGTFDGTTIRLFVDGRQIGSGTPSAGRLEYLLPDSNDLFIGDYPGCRRHVFSGTIDEVSVWGRALTPADVTAAMAPPEQGLSGTGGQSPPTGGGPPGSPTPGSPKPGPRPGLPSAVPALRALRMSASAFAVTAGSHRARRTRPVGSTITYTDTQAARSTFTVRVALSGVIRGTRCVRAPLRRRAAHPRRCTRNIVLGSFTHADRVGHNSFVFTGLRSRKLAPGSYRLDATPRAQGRTGRTVSIAFRIIP